MTATDLTASVAQVPTPGTAPAASVLIGRRLLAAAVVGAPALIAVNALFHPAVELSGAGFLAGAQTAPTAWFIVHVIAAFGALLGVPAAIGLRTLVRDRGSRVATAGVALTVLASPTLALAFAVEASVLRLAVTSLDPSSALQLAQAYARTPELYAVGIAVMGGTLGSVLLGLGLLRSRTFPAALPAAYVISTLVTVAGAPGTPIGPIAFGVVAAVSVTFAARILRPAGSPAPTRVRPT
jgi:hypothetical protein